MMQLPILTTQVTGSNLPILRERTREVGELFGLDELQRTRFTAAVSEIVRNTVQYAGEGELSFVFRTGESPGDVQQLRAQVQDRGPGIRDLPGVLAGRPQARGRIPLGIAGSRRLVDFLDVECPQEGGTRVTLGIALPRTVEGLTSSEVAERIRQLAARRPLSRLEEVQQQNRDMAATLQRLHLKQEELQLADERKNHFLATLAHELRGPLGTLRMSIDLMRHRPDMARDALAARREVMARQTDQLTHLVDELMDISRVSLGKVTLDHVPLELNRLVADAAEMSSAATTAKQHVVHLNASTEALWTQGDGGRLRQVFCNLIQNAARYTPAGGIITLSLRREGAYAVVDVADTGQGILADVLPRVFDMFVQGEAANVAQGGLGVGLTLVRRLTEDHGGTVSAASAGAGQGSCFTVVLPLSEPAGPAAPASAAIQPS